MEKLFETEQYDTQPKLMTHEEVLAECRRLEEMGLGLWAEAFYTSWAEQEAIKRAQSGA